MSGGSSLVSVHSLLIAVVSLVRARGLQNTGSVVVARELSRPVICGIFSDQGSNPCPLHWQQILYHSATTEAPTVSFHSFFFTLNDILLSGCITVCLSLHLWKDFLVASSFRQLYIGIDTCLQDFCFLFFFVCLFVCRVLSEYGFSNKLDR